jgi:ABC-type transport system involved in cytochrome bd biosynthesis fused ATPase/permease subunit
MSSFDSKSGESSKADEGPLHIDVKDLTFNYPGREPILRNLNMQLTNGARCLLIG